MSSNETSTRQWMIRFQVGDTKWEAGPYEDEKYARDHLKHLRTRKRDPHPDALLLTRTVTTSAWTKDTTKEAP